MLAASKNHQLHIQLCKLFKMQWVEIMEALAMPIELRAIGGNHHTVVDFFSLNGDPPRAVTGDRGHVESVGL